ALGGARAGARLPPRQRHGGGRAGGRRRLPALPGRPRGHRPHDRPQAGGAVRQRRPAGVAGRPARRRLPRQRHGDRPRAADPVPVERVLGGGRAEGAPPAREHRRRRARPRDPARAGRVADAAPAVGRHLPDGPPGHALAGAGRLPGRPRRLAVGRHDGRAVERPPGPPRRVGRRTDAARPAPPPPGPARPHGRGPGPYRYPDVHAPWRAAGTAVDLWNAPRALVGGWDDGLTRPAPLRLVEGRPAGTVGELVDGLCRRLCVQTFRPEHREALVEVLGGDPSAPAPSSPNGDLLEVVALVLDSPYFAL